MSTLSLHILNAHGIFSKNQLAMINSIPKLVDEKVRPLLDFPNVDIVIYHNPEYAIAETGIGGQTETPHIIFVPVDAKRELNKQELFLTLAHELHHAARQLKLGFPAALLEKVVSEGLADQFEGEIDPSRRPITYRKDVSESKIAEGLKELEKIGNSEEYDYYAWFFGTNGTYPNWFGYTLGNKIIQEYAAKHRTKPSKLVLKETKVLASLSTGHHLWMQARTQP